MGNVSEKDEFYEKERKEREKKCLELMKKEFPSHDDLDLIRFLLAREYEVKKASQMFQNYLAWKRDFKPGNISIEIFEKELVQNRGYFIGHTENKSPVFYFLAKNHFPQEEWEHSVHFGCLIHDAFVRLAEVPGSLTFCGIIDLKGVSIDNIDMKLIKKGIEVYQDFFPERLDRCFVIGLPSTLVGLWYVIENLFDDRTRKRIKVLKDDETLPDLFIPHLLPKECGGTQELSHDEFRKIIAAHYSHSEDEQKSNSS